MLIGGSRRENKSLHHPQRKYKTGLQHGRPIYVSTHFQRKQSDHVGVISPLRLLNLDTKTTIALTPFLPLIYETSYGEYLQGKFGLGEIPFFFKYRFFLNFITGPMNKGTDLSVWCSCVTWYWVVVSLLRSSALSNTTTGPSSPLPGILTPAINQYTSQSISQSINQLISKCINPAGGPLSPLFTKQP